MYSKYFQFSKQFYKQTYGISNKFIVLAVTVRKIHVSSLAQWKWSICGHFKVMTFFSDCNFAIRNIVAFYAFGAAEHETKIIT